MTESNTEINQESEVKRITVGEKLRQARELKKMSIADAAGQLMLTQENITNLEADQWESLHGRPYARGYFVSYVNFLGLPQSEMLALFADEYSVPEPSINPLKDQAAGSQFPWKALLFLVVLIIGVWFAYQYWLDMEQAKQPSSELSSMITPELEAASSVVADFGATLGTVPVEETLPIETERVVIEPAVEMNLISEAEEQLENIPAVFNGTAREGEDITVEPTIEPLDEQVAAVEDTFESTEIAAVESRSNKLMLQFSGDCWVEVMDNTNNKLQHKMARAGEVLEVAGELPLNVVLGNAAVVKVSYNNKQVDISENTRSNVARFSVGDNVE